MTASDDEYDWLCGGPLELLLTEEDYDRIDAICEAEPNVQSLKPRIAHLKVTVEDNRNPPSSATQLSLTIQPKSPFRLYRTNHLSVTDLVSPAWCEVQFEYGLHQESWRKVEDRPPTFITRKGKKITVVKEIAVAADEVRKAGQVAHHNLRGEIHGSPKRATTYTEKERMALRCVESLLTTGKCREFPVMGFIQEQYDEIHLHPIFQENTTKTPLKRSASATPPSSSRRLTKPLRSNDCATSTLENFSLAIPRTPTSRAIPEGNDLTSASDKPPQKTHFLYLIDDKTKDTSSVSQNSATFSNKMQLMAYKHILENLVSLSTPFDFNRLWEHLGLNSTERFSTAFKRELAPKIGEGDIPKSLQDCQELWTNAIHSLNVNGHVSQDMPKDAVHPNLTLVYRLREKAKETRQRWQRDGTPTLPDLEDRLLYQDLELQQAMLASFASFEAEVISRTNEQALEPTTPSLVSRSETEDNSDSKETGNRTGDIIGVIQFNHNDAVFNEHIRNTLKWWYGLRDPIGASEGKTGRCRICEYEMGCEWREAKANETSKKIVVS
ncbi:hypothetical protein M422DRAFT_53300 [Sphaerobolus stellatus SS14]|uniref:Exonuclease V, mitochondrial n=1 Tax=Sphaerobolus stellatus (strain SS14) TaxID=990650 RepID=A0A0C9V227_SPHS4|nr:hypothetical protein M422DRAFT_53300 [Sphaerobolus stellatus SS14]